jgi:methylenetetrahydrofolate reductase (NADPH)
MSVAPRLSFEFFPPKTAAMEASLWQAIARLAPLAPRFVSVTYGAGGSTRERTHATVARIRRETALEPAAHLTCVGASREEIDAVARDYWDAGIRHIVALRGDPPAGAGGYQPHPAGYAQAVDLVAGLKRVGDFEISVAAYPEVHPEATSATADLDNLKRKIDAGAARAITQFFFDAACFLRFRDRAAAAGIAVPIVPGVLPIVDFAQARKFAATCGASVPSRLEAEFASAGEDPRARAAVAERVAVAHCRQLIEAGIDALHFYTLNRAELVASICAALAVAAPIAAPVAVVAE